MFWNVRAGLLTVFDAEYQTLRWALTAAFRHTRWGYWEAKSQALYGGAWQEDETLGFNFREQVLTWYGGGGGSGVEIFTVRMVRHWSGNPERVWTCYPWRSSGANWTKPWATWSEFDADRALSRRVDWRPPQVPSILNNCVILCFDGIKMNGFKILVFRVQ